MSTRVIVAVFAVATLTSSCSDDGLMMSDYCDAFAEAFCSKGDQCDIWEFTLAEQLGEDCRATFVDGCCADDGDCDKTMVDQLNADPEDEPRLEDFIDDCTTGINYSSCTQFETMLDDDDVGLSSIDGCSL